MSKTKQFSLKELIADGYQIENGTIFGVSLNMEDYYSLVLNIKIKGYGWGCTHGGYKLGHGSLGSEPEEFKGYDKGLEAIMQIMNVVGVDDLFKMEGMNVRVAHKGAGSSVKIIGNIIEDKWFDYESFFAEENEGVKQ